MGTPELWVAVGFVILIAAVARPLGRAITAGLDARTARIRATLDEATRLREEAQHILAEYQRKQRDAAKECEALLARARDEAGRAQREAMEKLEESVARHERLALDKIAQAESEAAQMVRDVTVDVAIAATRKLIADRLDDRAAGRMVDDAIAELPAKLH
jgi:F-type H+-transporting ATPase subunit b